MANDFPTRVDSIILGTGLSECIISSSLSVNGLSVLHLDKLEHYGHYEGSVKISDLTELIKEWQLSDDSSNIENNDTILPILTKLCDVTHATIHWNVLKSEMTKPNILVSEELSGAEGDDSEDKDEKPNFQWTEEKILSLSRRIDLDLLPKLFFAESEPVTAIIESDVTRYLEFKFVSRLLSLSSDQKIKQIPVSRGDVFKSKLYSLKQKRQLCSFLEWCFSVTEDDTDLAEYGESDLRDFLTDKKGLDSDLQDVIIYSLAFQPSRVTTSKAVTSLKRLLNSMNKFGPYPIMWASYGSGEIPQAFARLSAVFGGIFCLKRSIESVKLNDQSEDKYLVKLTTGEELTTNQIIINKSYLSSHNPTHRYIGRGILLTNKSILPSENDKPGKEVTLLPYPLDGDSKVALVLEVPVDCSNTEVPELYIIHISCGLEVDMSAEHYFKPIVDNLFESGGASDKPSVLFSAYFNLPDHSSSEGQHPLLKDNENIHLISGLDSGIDMSQSLTEARRVFSQVYPDMTFLPRPPNPEDIIHCSEEPQPDQTSSSEEIDNPDQQQEEINPEVHEEETTVEEDRGDNVKEES